MNITVIGTGYVGLVTGTCFAEMGSMVTCVDSDTVKIDNLKKGIIPIYEPGLEPMVKRHMESGLLKFTTDLSAAMETSNILFIAVGTPPGEDGSADLQYVLSVAREIGNNLSDYSVIVDKSTVPIGTGEKVRSTIKEALDQCGKDIPFDVVSNPEFLKEGAAIDDFMRPDRIVIGTDSDRAKSLMTKLYAPFSRNHDKFIFMGIRDAEMTKYAANCLLATKISFMNEVALLCDKLDVDVEHVRRGIGSDPRIGYHFIYPGCGYGGSCFPKDVKALIQIGKDLGADPIVLQSVEDRNKRQKDRLFDLVSDKFGNDLTGKVFGVWGLSFKPGTDDMREAPSVVLIENLIEAGATVRAFDPVAMDQARAEFPSSYFDTQKIQLSDSQYDALDSVDALLLVTEWKPFRQPEMKKMKQKMKQQIIFDGRNIYDPQEMKQEGFEYMGIGRK